MSARSEGAKFLGLGLLAWIVLMGLGTVGGIFAVYYDNWFSSVTAEQRGQKAVREDTQANGDFRQSVYRHFFDLCASAQTSQEQIANLTESMKTADADRKANLQVSIDGLNMSLLDAVNEYNTKANDYTKAQFLDRKLPYPLNAKDTIECV